MIASSIFSSYFSLISNNSLEKLIVKVPSCNCKSNIWVSGGMIDLKPLGMMLLFLPSMMRPSSKSLARSTPSQAHVLMEVLAT